MAYNGPSLPTLDYVRRTLYRGGDMQGQVIPAETLVKVLKKSQATQACTVRNAVLPDLYIEPAEYRSRIDFIHCRFRGTTKINNCSFDRQLVIKQSRFEHGLTIMNCDFTKSGSHLSLDWVSINGDFSIEQCDFDYKPWLHAADFRQDCKIWAVSFRTSSDADRLIWGIQKCQFRGNTTLAIPSDANNRGVRLDFIQCRFADTSNTKIDAQGVVLDCRFLKSRIGGRLILSASKNGSAAEPGDHIVDVAECLVDGELDLQKLPQRKLAWFGLPRTILAGGRFWINADGLSEPLAKDRWRLFRTSPADQPGKLKSEQDLLDQVVPIHEKIRSVADQYEQLRNSFASIPGTDREEDFCHYKCMDYRHRAKIVECVNQVFAPNESVAEAGPSLVRWLTRMKPPSLPVSVIVVATLIGLGFLPLILPFERTLLLAAFGILCVFGYSHLLSYCARKRIKLIRLLRGLWRLTVLLSEMILFKWVIGYGIYLRRVLSSAVSVILLFAFVYGLIVCGKPELGNIRDSNSNSKNWSIWCRVADDDDPADQKHAPPVPNESGDKDPENVGPCCLVARLVYFSAVTFTTLGYGDYHPRGWLRAVAALEALLGGITLALVTVVLARRFMRR